MLGSDWKEQPWQLRNNLNLLFSCIVICLNVDYFVYVGIFEEISKLKTVS